MMNSTILEGKTIIVTGGATGIGQAFALTSAAHGAKVMVADMNSADETLDLIRSNGSEAEYVKTDVSDEASAKAMAKATQDWSGRVDGLINNAAYFREVKLTPFEEISSEIWDRIFDVNVKGIWQCCKGVMPAMRESGGGSIINISQWSRLLGNLDIFITSQLRVPCCQ